MPKHALLSASGAHRWLECPPSARLEEEITAALNISADESASPYAKEGTAAHELAEVTAKYWLGIISEDEYENTRDELSKGEYYSAEMQDCANAYGKLVAEKFKAAKDACEDAFVELEVTLDLSKWVKNGFGTSDCIIVADGTLEIIDFKYGKGVRVGAARNPQMMLYALGAYLNYNTVFCIDNICMTIFQPRLSGEQDSDELSLTDLLEWGNNYVKPRAKLAYKGEGKFSPSAETCKFCKAKDSCRARADKNITLFDEAPDTKLISLEEAADILERASDIKAWIEDLEKRITAALRGGEKVNGWKLVIGRSNRKFSDEKKVVAAMTEAGFDENELYSRSLLTPAQMEKAFGADAKKILAPLIIKPLGSPTLAPESDKRPEYKPEAEILAAFDDAD